MTKTLQYLTVTTLAAGLAVGITWGAKGGGKPGGGGGGNPDKVGVIADFDAIPSRMEPDGEYGEYGHQYDATNIGDGWVEMPGSGNFVLNLGSSRSLSVNLQFPIGTLPADDEEASEEAKRAYGDFVSAYPSGIVPVGFVSINRHCRVEDILSTDPNDPDYPDNYYICGETAAAEGSLKAMQYEDENQHGDHGTDLLLWFSPRFPNPYRSNAQFQIYCGWQESSPVAVDNVSFMVGHCSAPLDAATDTTCAEWRIVPYNNGSINLEPITGDSDANACTLVEYYSKGKTSSTIEIMDFDLKFGLTVYRDENRNGIPDANDE